jgi:hypothetical protein
MTARAVPVMVAHTCTVAKRLPTLILEAHRADFGVALRDLSDFISPFDTPTQTARLADKFPVAARTIAKATMLQE